MKINIKVILTVIVLAVAVSFIFFYFPPQKPAQTDVKGADSGQNENVDFFKYKSQYLGDNTNDVNIAQSLSFPDGLKYSSLELLTGDNDILTMRIILSNETDKSSEDYDVKRSFSYNAMLVFALIQNCEQVTYCVNQNGDVVELSSRQRPWAVEVVKGDPYEITDTKENFEKYLQDLSKIDFAKIPVYSSNLEQSIANAILSVNEGIYYEGELAAQGHITLLTRTEGMQTAASVYAKYFQFQFQNGILERCAGSERPYKFTFTKDKYGNYILSNTETPKEGAYYMPSLYELFTDDVVDKIKSISEDNDATLNIENQIIQSAKAYLDSINRGDAKISLSYQEKAYPPLSESNAMEFDILYKAYTDYPYFVGTIEKIEDGKRYVYETGYEKEGDADIFSFKKTLYETGDVTENVKVKLQAGTLTTLDGELRQTYYDIKKQAEADLQSVQENAPQ